MKIDALDRINATLDLIYTMAELNLIDVNVYWDIFDDNLAEELACKHENGLFR